MQVCTDAVRRALEMPSAPKRRPTVGDTVRVVKARDGHANAELHVGEVGIIVRDDHDRQPYELNGIEGGMCTFYEEEVELVEAGTSAEHDALWYVNTLAGMLKYSVSRPADWNGTYVLLNGTCHDGYDLDTKARAAIGLNERDTTCVDHISGVAIRDGSPDGGSRENTTKYWRWLYERVLATKGLA